MSPAKVVIWVNRKHIKQTFNQPYFKLYDRIEAMLGQVGATVERRALPRQINSATRVVDDDFFNDGNLHILHDRRVRMPNVLNAAWAYFDGFWYLDPQGVGFSSSIAQKPYDPGQVRYYQAKPFYDYLCRRFRETRQTRVQQGEQDTDYPEGAIAVFFQGTFPKRAGATTFDDFEMLRDVLAGAGERPVLVKMHPRLLDIDTLMRLSQITEDDPRLIPTEGNVHDILAASAVSVSINSTVALEGFLHRTPAILYGKSDFHHYAETITAPGQFAEALERALQRKGGYAQYLTWFLRQNCLELAAPDLEDRIWAIFAQAGFPKERLIPGG